MPGAKVCATTTPAPVPPSTGAFAASDRRRPGRVLASAALALAVLAAPSLAAAESASEADLRRQIAEQQALLDALQHRVEADEKTSPDGVNASVGNPRVAPSAPEVRELPPAIFDEERITIAPGAWGDHGRMKVIRLTLDADGDERPELVRFHDQESNLIVRQEEDRNYDGHLDAFSSFAWGDLTERVVDEDDDGRPDGWEQYEDGRMTRREVDRDRDGVRDAFYDYEGGSLVLEQHDSDNDGEIDREIRYRDRMRTAAEEDLDFDGRPDVWYRYTTEGGMELVARIERDKQGRGRPDVFETFVADGGRAALARREEDVDGDGTADIVSIYRNGKLVRRELASPELRPL